MTPQTLRTLGIVGLVVCAICLFVAVERYNTNANNVRAMNQMGGGMPFQTLGVGKMEPATPTATKYALALALVSGVGGVVCLIRARSRPLDATR